MKLIVVVIFSALAISVHADEEWKEIDWANIVPVQDMPGFWDGREIRPAFYPGDQTRTGRIVGGAIVTPHAHPYQAGLLMNFNGGTGLCGGSLISLPRILTAAHCPIGSFNTQVIMGAHQITATESTQQRRTVQSAQYRIHPSYNPNTLANDIAVLIILNPFLTSQQIRSIQLAPASAPSYVGITATVSGWGRISDSSSATSAQLRSVQNNVITNTLCAATFGSTIIDSTLCTATTGGRGTCSGWFSIIKIF
jgi:chymotrypsin